VNSRTTLRKLAIALDVGESRAGDVLAVVAQLIEDRDRLGDELRAFLMGLCTCDIGKPDPNCCFHSRFPDGNRFVRPEVFAPEALAARAESVEARLSDLVEAAETHLRYIDNEVVDGLRSKRHTREVVANIAEHQSRNLREAIERSA
jgi:hypothetical protein